MKTTSPSPSEVRPSPFPEGAETGRTLEREGLKVLAAATHQLAAVSDTPRLDAELLMAHALGITREALILGDHATPPAFGALLARRMAHEPIAYIIGSRDFWTVSLRVTPAVLIPRPDSETLIEAAVARFGRAGPKRVLDLGTGSGALLLAALDQWPGATGVGIDTSPKALAVARANAMRIAPRRARFKRGDWGEGLGERFDLILCNPPYVESGAVLAPDVAAYEPASALFAGPEGLDDYERLIPQLAALLAPQGIICLEIGSSQAARVTDIARRSGFYVFVHNDLGGRPRCLALSI